MRLSPWTGIERLLGTHVHLRERALIALCFADLFALLAAYYVAKVAREPLILLGNGGLERRNLARALQAGLLLGLVPAYGALANRVDPRRLVSGLNLLFLVALLSFFGLAAMKAPIGLAFFVWLGIFSTLSIAQFWSLANDLFTEEQGKRLFPAIAMGGTLGGIVGAQVAARLGARLGPSGLLCCAAAFLGVHAALAHRIVRRGTAAPEPPRQTNRPEGPDPLADPRGGFTLVRKDRYLLLIALSVLLLNVVNTTGDFVLAQQVKAEAARRTQLQAEQYLSAFYGDFQTWVTILTALTQALLVSRLFRALGLSAALYVAPLLSLSGYGLITAIPVIGIARSVKILENSADYSLQNTLQQALFLPTSRAAKYKAKAATDTFFVRLGDLGSAAVVGASLLLGLSTSRLAAVNTVLAALWLGAVALLVRVRRRRELLDP